MKGFAMKKCLVVALCVLLIVSACGKKEEQKPEASDGTRRLNIVTTTGMIADVVKNIGGDFVNVTALMGPGVDPHLYKATEGDMRRMADADIIFYNGLHLEGAMGQVLEKLKEREQAFAVTDKIDRTLLNRPPGFEGTFDPHVWFDVRMWSMTAEYVRDVMIDFDKVHAVQFGENAQTYVDSLHELHSYVYELAKSVPPAQRALITAHDAFGYFGKAYGFEVRGLQGISTASEAGTADVQELVQFIVDRRIAAIFVESSVSPKTIEAVQAAVAARGFDVKIGGQLFSDAMGKAGTEEGTYIGMVRHNIHTIVNALLGGRMAQPI
jgi:manganese/zinc/iron transport system substrate-binding protein